jgi:hypothetical protein
VKRGRSRWPLPTTHGCIDARTLKGLRPAPALELNYPPPRSGVGLGQCRHDGDDHVAHDAARIEKRGLDSRAQDIDVPRTTGSMKLRHHAPGVRNGLISRIAQRRDSRGHGEGVGYPVPSPRSINDRIRAAMRRRRATQREADIVRKLVPLSPFLSDPTEGNRAAYLQQVRREREKYALQSQLAAVREKLIANQKKRELLRIQGRIGSISRQRRLDVRVFVAY